MDILISKFLSVSIKTFPILAEFSLKIAVPAHSSVSKLFGLLFRLREKASFGSVNREYY